MEILTIIVVASLMAFIYAIANEWINGNSKWTEVVKYVSFSVLAAIIIYVYVIKQISL